MNTRHISTARGLQRIALTYLAGETLTLEDGTKRVIPRVPPRSFEGAANVLFVATQVERKAAGEPDVKVEHVVLQYIELAGAVVSATLDQVCADLETDGAFRRAFVERFGANLERALEIAQQKGLPALEEIGRAHV